MATNLFDQLKQAKVPPVPRKFDHEVHQKLNKRLLVVHVFDFVFRVLPFALGHFATAVGGLVWLTLSGNFPPLREKPRDETNPGGD